MCIVRRVKMHCNVVEVQRVPQQNVWCLNGSQYDLETNTFRGCRIVVRDSCAKIVVCGNGKSCDKQLLLRHCNDVLAVP